MKNWMRFWSLYWDGKAKCAEWLGLRTEQEFGNLRKSFEHAAPFGGGGFKGHTASPPTPHSGPLTGGSYAPQTPLPLGDFVPQDLPENSFAAYLSTNLDLSKKS